MAVLTVEFLRFGTALDSTLGHRMIFGSKVSLAPKHTNISLAILLLSMSCSDPTGVKTRVRDRWYQSQQAASFGRPAVVSDLVVFGTGDGHLVGRNRSSGARG